LKDWGSRYTTFLMTYAAPDGDKSYTLEIRKSRYDYIAKCDDEEAAKGNPWVKFGVALARGFSLGRKNQIIDDWVPKESAYWS
jgi:hypothetical protein